MCLASHLPVYPADGQVTDNMLGSQQSDATSAVIAGPHLR